ncbi:MAG TPA: hypothetical protein VHN99_01265 [Deinococcales bacterium]|nr:hypothetical protein [Deinococcales bacterium]
MVRKQVRLPARLNAALAARARELGLSEAEVVRRALEAALAGPTGKLAEATRNLRALIQSLRETSASYPFPEGNRFRREDAYSGERRFER